MKTLYTTLLLLFTFSVFAQNDVQSDINLSGVVVEQNSKYRTGKTIYIQNASIKSPDATMPKLSDVKGNFTLTFTDKPSGDVTRVYVKKSDYELVNEEELKKVTVLGRKLPFKIVLCKEGTLYENQITYYKIAKDASYESYKEKVAILEKEGREREQLLAELQIAFNQKVLTVGQANELLLKQLNDAQEQARELADKFLTVNLDDQTQTYQNAFRAFENKDIDLAIAILDSVDIELRLALNTRERDKEQGMIDTLERSIIRRNEEIQQDINQCVFKARLHILKYEFKKAEVLFETAIKYDSTNHEVIFEAAYFLAEQNQFSKAQQYYEQVLKIYRNLAKKNPDVYLPNVATTLNNLGALFYANNEMVLAKKQYEEALEIYRSLAKKNPDVYLPNVAITLNNLGVLLSDNNEMGLAKKQYEEALEIYRSLAKKNERAYNLDVCMTALNIGLFYKQLLEETGDLTLKQKGLDLMQDTRKRLAIYPASNPTVIKYLKYVDILENFFKSFDGATFKFKQLLKPFDELKKANQTEKSPNQKVKNQQEIVKILHQIDEQIPNNKEVLDLLSNNYGSLAWHQLFTKEFSDAEAAARKGLEIDASQEWINTNLALALLYQGKYDAAKAVYLSLKDKPYGDATYAKTFLADLDALEKEGITHPDVAKIRKLLKK